MKLFVGLLAGALGVVMVIAGANGSALKLYATIFGKAAPGEGSDTVGLGGASFGQIPSSGATGGTGPGGPGTGPGGTGGGNGPTFGSPSGPQAGIPGSGGGVLDLFNGTNTLTGQGVLV